MFIFYAWLTLLVIVVNILILRWVFKINAIVFQLQNIANNTDEMLKLLRKEVEEKETQE